MNNVWGSRNVFLCTSILDIAWANLDIHGDVNPLHYILPAVLVL